MKNLIIFLVLSLLVASCASTHAIGNKKVKADKNKNQQEQQAQKEQSEQITPETTEDEGLAGEAIEQEPMPRNKFQVYFEPFNKRPKDLKSQSVDYVLGKDAPKKLTYKYPYVYTGIMLDYDGFDSDNYLSNFGNPYEDYPGDAVVKTKLPNNVVVLRIFSDEQPNEEWFKVSPNKPKFIEAKKGTKPKSKSFKPKKEEKQKKQEGEKPDDSTEVQDFS